MVDGRFFGHFFWKVEGTVHIHVSHVQLLYMVINVWGINVWRGILVQLTYMVINVCNIHGN